MTLDELIDAGELDGYTPEAPIGGMLPAAEIDREVAATATCSKCGEHGLDYHPYRIPDVSYRAFAVCPRCREAHEF